MDKKSKLIPLLLHKFHDTLAVRHCGVKRKLARISIQFYWKSMSKDVREYVARCLMCQQTKYSTQVPPGLLQYLHVPNAIWEDITLDFIVGLLMSKSFMVIFVVVDRLTKSAHFGGLPTNFTAKKIAELFFDMVVKHHGYPKSIMSDWDTIFFSNLWNSLMEMSATELKHSTAYHFQTDGQTEIVNRELEQYLRAMLMRNPRQWTSMLG